MPDINMFPKFNKGSEIEVLKIHFGRTCGDFGTDGGNFMK